MMGSGKKQNKKKKQLLPFLLFWTWSQSEEDIIIKESISILVTTVSSININELRYRLEEKT